MILALDAATSTVVLGLAAPDGQILSERRLRGGRGDVLPGLLEECLAETGAQASDISEVVCGVGPGSFTGIRIALSFAHGLAFRRNLSLVGVSSLCAALCDDGTCDLAVLDALRGEAYVRDGLGGTDVRRPLSELAPLLRTRKAVLEGRPDFEARFPGHNPLAAHLTAAGVLAARGHASCDPVPNYLRASAPEEMRAAAKG